MLQPKKVRVVTQTEMFEHGEGKDILKLKEYCEDQPFWNGILMHAFSGMLLYILAALLAVLVIPDWFFGVYKKIGNVWSAVIVAVSMAVFAVGYSLICDLVTRVRYKKNRSQLCGYRANRKILERLEREQEQEQDT